MVFLAGLFVVGVCGCWVAIDRGETDRMCLGGVVGAFVCSAMAMALLVACFPAIAR